MHLDIQAQKNLFDPNKIILTNFRNHSIYVLSLFWRIKYLFLSEMIRPFFKSKRAISLIIINISGGTKKIASLATKSEKRSLSK